MVSVSDLDASRITRNLYQVGFHTVSGCQLAIDADIVVNLAPDAGVKLLNRRPGSRDPLPDVYEIGLQDHKDDLEKLPVLLDMAKFLARQVKAGKTVLVCCFLGANRSALLSSLTVCYLYPDWCGKKVVSHVRSKRPISLGNQHFEKFLKGLPSSKHW